MGVMRFLIHPQRLLDDWDQCPPPYISGMDGRVFPTRVEQYGNVLECTRAHPDSGRLQMCWPVEGYGRPVVATSSLREREAPYLLPLELARGKISQVRDQVSEWEIAGMKIPEEFAEPNREAHRLFCKAVVLQEQPETAAELAMEALAWAFRSAEVLAKSYTQQRMLIQRRRAHRAPLFMGCNLGDIIPENHLESVFCSAFNAALTPVQWKDIEPEEGQYNWEICDRQLDWCQENRLLSIAGPLLDLSPGGLPDWLWTWEHDFLNLQSFVCDFVETAISRYLGRVRHWEIAARGNTGGALSLSEDNRLPLVARSLEIARQLDDEIMLILRVDQPWGGYQARGQHRLSPLQFVDALIRSGVGVSAVNLEIAVGYIPRGSASRDLLDFSRLIDLWSCLGIPLMVTLAFPSDTGPDRKAHSDYDVGRPTWKTPWNAAAQAEWIRSFLPMLMAKPAMMGAFWAHLTDAGRHRFPHAGLIDAHSQVKPGLQALLDSRDEWTQND